jgi:molybdopterin converting factor small subunit
MKVNVNVTSFLLLYDVLKKKKEIQVELPGNTVGDLIQILIQKYGRSVKEALLDEEGQIPWDVRIIKNMNEFLNDDRLNTILKDGDTLYFMVSG